MTALPRLRAPQQHRGILAVPPRADVPALLESNRRLLDSQLGHLRQQARQEVIHAACAYLRAMGEDLPKITSERLILAGHQPELFHPGVWVKNFALCGLARQHGLTPLNLIVDNDTVKSTALSFPRFRLPLQAAGQSAPVLAALPFDLPAGETPWEQYTLQDRELLRSLPQRLDFPADFQPLLPDFWAEVQRQTERTPVLGEALVAARRTLERRWGCHNLELPVSLLAETPSFANFVAHLLLNLPRFHRLHNEIVQNYRRQHGLRSRSHPVPDLAREDDWLEAPFWGWRREEKHRQRLFVKKNGAELRLRAGEDRWPAWSWTREARAALEELHRTGCKIRPRALTNTLFARLFVGDLFIHGIGGGKYDELTDELIRRFYDREPPRYLVLSATLLLPLPSFPVTAVRCRNLAQEIRDLHFNPQRHVEAAALLGPDLLAERERLLALPTGSRRQRRERCRALRSWHEQVVGQLQLLLDQRRAELQQLHLQLRANAVLRRRDYSFVLYPETLLRPFCQRFLGEDW